MWETQRYWQLVRGAAMMDRIYLFPGCQREMPLVSQNGQYKFFLKHMPPWNFSLLEKKVFPFRRWPLEFSGIMLRPTLVTHHDPMKKNLPSCWCHTRHLRLKSIYFDWRSHGIPQCQKFSVPQNLMTDWVGHTIFSELNPSVFDDYFIHLILWVCFFFVVCKLIRLTLNVC